MRGRVLHRASPELNICCANISWVRFYKIGSGRVGKGGDACAHTQSSLSSLRKLDRVARAASTMKAGANFAHPTVDGFVFPKCVFRATCRPYDRRNEKTRRDGRGNDALLNPACFLILLYSSQAESAAARRAQRLGRPHCKPALPDYIAASPALRSTPEGWPSGLRRTLGKRVYGKPYRGFESHSLRQLNVRHCPSTSNKSLNYMVF
jgi:hypothetical protein